MSGFQTKRLKTGQFDNRTIFENAEIRTSGFRTSTVHIHILKTVQASSVTEIQTPLNPNVRHIWILDTWFLDL